MKSHQYPQVQIPNFVSGPYQRNFNLSAWVHCIAPMKQSELTPDEAAHLRDSLNHYLEYIKEADGQIKA